MNFAVLLKLVDAIKLLGAIGAVLLILYPIDESGIKHNLLLRIALEQKVAIGTILLALVLLPYLPFAARRFLKLANELVLESVAALWTRKWTAGVFGLLTFAILVSSLAIFTSATLQLSFAEVRGFKIAPDVARQSMIREVNNEVKNSSLSHAKVLLDQIKDLFPNDPRNVYIDKKISALNQLISLSRLLSTNAEALSQLGEKGAAGRLYAAAFQIWPDNEFASEKLKKLREEFTAAKNSLADFYRACGQKDSKRISETFSLVGEYYFSRGDASSIGSRLSRAGAEASAIEEACEFAGSSQNVEEFVEYAHDQLFGGRVMSVSSGQEK